MIIYKITDRDGNRYSMSATEYCLEDGYFNFFKTLTIIASFNKDEIFSIVEVGQKRVLNEEGAERTAK